MANLKLPELDQRNLVHVVKENFERAGLKAYAIRMIYMGEHGLSSDEMTKLFRKSVKYVNQGYTDIPVNGLLLIYDSYFVHILEGSEDTIHRQIRFLFNIAVHYLEKMKRQDEEEAAAAKLAAEQAAAESNPFGLLMIKDSEEEPPEPEEKPERIAFRKMKMLMVYHSITTFLFDDWRAVYARPPSLVGKLDIYAPIGEHMEQLKICLTKITKLCQLAHQEGDNLSFIGLSANDPKIEALPEVALLDYLLASPHIYDLRECADYHRRVDDYTFYFELVWPLPTAYTPCHLYKLKIDDTFVDPLPVMPWEMKSEDEEERDDQHSKGSSSS
ncbi:hypothetical protein O0L34_g18266 [Tuta absoluta]|nr:hypothetical protein O0L34_g18266 [Tuta absoluta]